MGATTRQTWPDETPEDVFARLAAEFGEDTARRLMEMPPRKKFSLNARQNWTAGERSKLGNGISVRAEKRRVRVRHK